MTRGMHFKGNTSSADAELPSSVGAPRFFQQLQIFFSDNCSAIVDFLIDVSLEEDVLDVSRSTHPKEPSKISSKEEVSVPARAILILPNPSCQSLAAFFYR